MSGTLVLIIVLGFIPLLIALVAWYFRDRQPSQSARRLAASSELAVSALIAAAILLAAWRFTHVSSWWPSVEGKWLISTTVRGAELWVNGVNLGKTPLITTQKEFLAKVPPWDKPPADFAQEGRMLPPAPFRNTFVHSYPRWESCDSLETGVIPGLAPGHYYVQFKYAGETGLFTTGFGGGASGSTEPRTVHLQTSTSFPQRDARLKSLLDLARLANYHVGEPWFTAIETFNEDGYLALRQAAPYEPGMLAVLGDWARWKYHLNEVKTPDEAWATFQKICREADQRQQYFTASVAGRAVELLADQLDPDRVEAQAESVLGTFQSYVYQTWKVAGQRQFGFSYDLGTTNLGQDNNGFNNGLSGQSAGRSGSAWMPPRAYTIAHAIRLLWQKDRGREIFRQRLAPRLIAYFYDYNSNAGLPALEFAAAIGGPQVDQFLLQQKWSKALMDFNGSDWWVDGIDLQSFYPGDARVNRWFYLLSILNDDTGARFRADHSAEILQMFSALLSKANNLSIPDDTLDFLTSDRTLGTAFYPQFAQIVRHDNPDEAIFCQWRYLSRIDADSSLFVDAFLQTARADGPYPHWPGAFIDMEPARRIKLATILLDLVNHDPALQKTLNGDNPTPWVIDALKHETLSTTEQMMSDLVACVADPVKHGPPDWWLKRTDLWFSLVEGSQSPLPQALLQRPEPALRILTLSAVRGAPNPANLKILQQLLLDPDAHVRQEAAKLDAELHVLMTRQPKDFTSDGS